MEYRFNRVISLGWFCGPAMNIKEMGYRDASYPFDWLLTHEYSGIIELLSNRGVYRFANEELLQYSGEPGKWYSNRYVISLFHDFNPYEKVKDQISKVNRKYERRFARLYNVITEPTLFVRYIKDAEEAYYISSQYDRILDTIKCYNSENNIVYVGNDDIREYCHFPNVLFVKPDDNDYVARHFLKQAPELEEFIKINVRQPTPPCIKKETNMLKLKTFFQHFRRIAVNDNPIHQYGVLERLPKDAIVLFKEKKQCSGCGACKAICSQKAISMRVIEDFSYPVIDQLLCVQCRQCILVCPFK